MLMRHKNMIKTGMVSLRASKVFAPGLRHYVGLAPKAANRVGRLLPIVVSDKRWQCMPANSRRICLTRCYSSESTANNAVENKENSTICNPQEPENKENYTPPLLENEKILTRGERFRDNFLKRIVPWEEINDSLHTFPYYIHEGDKNILVECVASRLKHKKRARDAHGGRLSSSSGRILLQTIPGAELYREKLVRGLAKELQVPLMVLDSCTVPPYDFSQPESDEENSGNDYNYDYHCCSSDDDDYSDDSDPDSDDEDETPTSSKTDFSQPESDEENSGNDYNYDYHCCSSDDDDYSDDSDPDSDDEDETPTSSKTGDSAKSLLKQGDRVKYVGENTTPTGANNRTLSKGQRGEVHKVNGDKVAVVFYSSGLGTNEAVENDEKSPKPLVEWLDVKHIKQDEDAQTHDCHIAIEVLCEVLESREPVIVYFPESFWWLSRSASWTIRHEFFNRVKEMFDKLSGRMVLICGQNTWEVGSKELKESWKKLVKGLKETARYEEYEMRKLFTNVLCIKLPKDEDLLKTFREQVVEDKPKIISRSNLSKMHTVLKEHGLLCTALECVDIDGLVLNKQKAEKIIGWATNHYFSTQFPSAADDRMNVPQASLELAITRLKEEETEKKPSQSSSKCPKDVASGKRERSFVSAVVSPGDIGVKFDDVGALEVVKNALNELVILPLKMPQLFSHGNLLRPCKGLLLFGPPGTGKTLIAKALATEAGANFINVTPSSLTSMWYGEEEKLVRALFSFARKLAPVVVFMDEIDALLGARGGASEHEATRKLRNEFMASWDGLTSKEGERILVLGATNRPFDIDDAVIRRMPRRIYVGLPDLENRSKILKIHLAKEDLESGFSFEQLAAATEGYSGSDLKNLCVAAAYKPVQDFLKQESKSQGDIADGAPALRPLSLDDFIHSKAKVAPSVAYNSTSLVKLRQWNERYGEGGSRD